MTYSKTVLPKSSFINFSKIRKFPIISDLVLNLVFYMNFTNVSFWYNFRVFIIWCFRLWWSRSMFNLYLRSHLSQWYGVGSWWAFMCCILDWQEFNSALQPFHVHFCRKLFAHSSQSNGFSPGHRYCIKKAFLRCEFVCDFSSYWIYKTPSRKYCIYMDFDRCEYVYDFVMIDGSYIDYDKCHIQIFFFSFFNWDDFLDFFF